MLARTLSLMKLRSSSSIVSLTAVAAFAMSPAAVAEAAAELTEITVSATKNPVEAFSVPAAVSVVSKDEIDDFMASSISDIFESVPGLSFGGGPRRNGEVPSIRGLEGEGVVILYDGVRQSFLSGHDGRFFIEPNLLKSAEVIRGNGSALYGSGAVGGVLSFNTVDAKDLLGGKTGMGYRLEAGYQGVDDEWQQNVALFGTSEDERFDAVASLTLRNSSDITLGDGSSLQADDSIASGLAKFSYQASDALRLSASWLAYRNDAVEPNNGQGNNTGDLMDKDIVSDTFRFGGVFNPESALVDLQFSAYINQTNVEEADQDTDRVINRDVETKGFFIDNRSRFEFNGQSSLTLTYGGEYYRDEQVGTDTDTADGNRGGVPNAKADTLGLFVQAELKLDSDIGEFYIIPGVRYDKFENEQSGGVQDTSESAISPRFSASWKPVPEFMVYGSYAEAFRAPSFNEIYADDVHFTIPLGPFVSASNFFIPNLGLSPERSKTWEFGAGFDLEDLFTDEDRLTLKASYFTSDVSDLIDLEVIFELSPSCFVPTIPAPCTAGTSQNVNTGRAELDGFELEAQYDSPRFRGRIAYSSVNGTDKDTDEYVGILSPGRLYALGEVKVPEVDARIGARVTLASSFDKTNDPANNRPSYEKLDLFAVWQPKGELEGLRIDLGIDNVTDAAIETVFAGVVDPGRNAKLRIGWTGTF